MNTDTGDLKRFNEKMEAPWEPVDMADATEKQKQEMKVSLQDHTSTLGKILTARRYRTLRRKGVLR